MKWIVRVFDNASQLWVQDGGAFETEQLARLHRRRRGDEERKANRSASIRTISSVENGVVTPLPPPSAQQTRGGRKRKSGPIVKYGRWSVTKFAADGMSPRELRCAETSISLRFTGGGREGDGFRAYITERNTNGEPCIKELPQFGCHSMSKMIRDVEASKGIPYTTLKRVTASHGGYPVRMRVPSLAELDALAAEKRAARAGAARPL